MENPIKMDDLGVPLFLETPHCSVYNYLFSSFRCRALFLPNSSTVATHGSCFSYYEFWWTHVEPHGSAIGGFARKIKEGSTCWGWEPWERFTNGSTALSWSTWNSNTYILNCLPYLRDQTFDSTTWMFGYYASNCIPNVAFITCTMQPWSDWRILFHVGICCVFLSTEVKEANFTRWQKFGVSMRHVRLVSLKGFGTGFAL